MNITVEDYHKAQKILEDYKICDWHSCKKFLKTKDAKKTICYGAVKHWCEPCYKKIKDD